MAELLIKATDNLVSNDIERDFHESFKRGYIVDVRPNGFGWGSKEGLPKFVVLQITDATVEELLHLKEFWERQIEFTIVNSNSSGGYRVDVSVSAACLDVSGTAGLTQSQVEAFLTKWNFDSIVTTSANNVRFDIAITEAVISEGFWEADVSAIVFNTSYNNTTGLITVDVDWSATTWDNKFIQSTVLNRGGNIISADAQTKTGSFTITKATVFEEFKRDVRQAVEGIWCPRKYLVPASVVTVIENAGGTYETTKSEALAWLQNKLDN